MTYTCVASLSPLSQLPVAGSVQTCGRTQLGLLQLENRARRPLDSGGWGLEPREMWRKSWGTAVERTGGASARRRRPTEEVVKNQPPLRRRILSTNGNGHCLHPPRVEIGIFHIRPRPSPSSYSISPASSCSLATAPVGDGHYYARVRGIDLPPVFML